MNSYTQEMEDWFVTRTEKHIKLVRKFCRVLQDKFDRFESLYKISEAHDETKYRKPEIEPYIHITWQYKMKDEGKKYDPPQKMKDAMNNATFHHIVSNPHHPEFWDKNLSKDAYNRENRDEPGKKMVDAKRMHDLYIAEMVCDWTAMSEEKGTSLRGWADKNVNVRWGFNDKQSKLIYSLIDYLEGYRKTND